MWRTLLVCFPELHGTSKIVVKSCSSSPHLHLSSATCFQLRPAALTIPRSMSRLGLKRLACQCRAPLGFIFSASHHCRCLHFAKSRLAELLAIRPLNLQIRANNYTNVTTSSPLLVNGESCDLKGPRASLPPLSSWAVVSLETFAAVLC